MKPQIQFNNNSKKQMKNLLFFRNDDVRNKLDKSLIEITNLFIEYNIPITHAVEPANITKEVVDWLIKARDENPNLVNIMQHGYAHAKKNKYLKGEFGGQRTYEEQFHEIKHGKELMNKYFGEDWFPVFNYPYGPYNLASMKALDQCGFKVVNSHFNSDWKRKIFYTLGHLLKKGRLFDHHISWNLDFYPGTNLFEIDVNVSFIKKYFNEEYDCEMFTLEELINKTKEYFNYQIIGVLLHHRYHNTPQRIELVDRYLEWCKNQKFEFVTIEDIYNKFNNNDSVHSKIYFPNS